MSYDKNSNHDKYRVPFDQYFTNDDQENEHFYDDRSPEYKYDTSNYYEVGGPILESQENNYISQPTESNRHEILQFDWNHSCYQPTPVVIVCNKMPKDTYNMHTTQTFQNTPVYNYPDDDCHAVCEPSCIPFHEQQDTPHIPRKQNRGLPKWIQEGLEKMEKEKWKKLDKIKNKPLNEETVTTETLIDDAREEQLMKKVLEVATKILLDITKTNVKSIGSQVMNSMLAKDATVVSLRESSSLNVLKESFLSSESASDAESSTDEVSSEVFKYLGII